MRQKGTETIPSLTCPWTDEDGEAGRGDEPGLQRNSCVARAEPEPGSGAPASPTAPLPRGSSSERDTAILGCCGSADQRLSSESVSIPVLHICEAPPSDHPPALTCAGPFLVPTGAAQGSPGMRTLPPRPHSIYLHPSPQGQPDSPFPDVLGARLSFSAATVAFLRAFSKVQTPEALMPQTHEELGHACPPVPVSALLQHLGTGTTRREFRVGPAESSGLLLCAVKPATEGRVF